MKLAPTLRNMAKSCASLGMTVSLLVGLVWSALPADSHAEEPKVLKDQEFYTKGSFIAYAGPWSTYFGAGKSMKRGVDFADEIAVRPESFPSNVEFTWHWPLTPAKESGVYGCNAISFGSYDGGVPQTPITPRQVKELGALELKVGFEVARPVGDFNVLAEFFLTKSVGGDKVAEVGFFLRPAKSAIEFVNAGEQIGTYTDALGRAWKVAAQPAPAGPFYMFLPTTEVLTGTIDFKAALAFLREKGRFTGEEWFNGLAFGIEPVTGSGSARVQSLSVTYK